MISQHPPHHHPHAHPSNGDATTASPGRHGASAAPGDAHSHVESAPLAAGAGATCWPPDRFYWAVLDAPVRRPGPLGAGLLVDLQDHVPVDVADLHAVGVPLEPARAGAGARTLVCAAPRDALRDLPDHLDTLVPLAVPDGLGAGANPAELNLLAGAFEPRAKRRRRQRMHVTAMAGTLALAAIVSLGLSRRSAALEHAVASAANASAPGRVTTGELRTLRALALRAAAEPAPVDVAAHLAAMLRAWPSGANGGGMHADVQSLSVDARRIALTVSVDGDPGAFLATLSPPRGYAMGQPGIGTSQSKPRLALTFTPSVEPPEIKP